MANVSLTEVGKTAIDLTGTTCGATNVVQFSEGAVIFLENTAAGTIGIEIPANRASVNVPGHGTLALASITHTVPAGPGANSIVAPPAIDYASGGSLNLNVTSGTAANLQASSVLVERR